MTDEGIIELFFERSDAAITETQRLYGRYFHSIAYGIVWDNADAEEIVNDTYLQLIGLEKIGTVDGTDGCCALAKVPEDFADVRALTEHIRAAVGLPAVKFVDSGRKIKTAAVCCGGGASFFEAAVLSGADVFVSGDFRHNHAADALRAQISLVDAGHYETEALVRDRVIARLSAALPSVQFLRAESDQPIFQYQLMPSCGADSCGA